MLIMLSRSLLSFFSEIETSSAVFIYFVNAACSLASVTLDNFSFLCLAICLIKNCCLLDLTYVYQFT